MKRREVTERGGSSGRATFHARALGLIDHVQDLDRSRLLEPTSLPKVLRGRPPFRRPQTAIIAYAAQRAHERRATAEALDTEKAMNDFLRQRRSALDRLVKKLR